MTTTASSTALVMIQPAFTDAERLALAGFLAGYRGLTRAAYALDLRQFTAWCRARSLALFTVRRADIESFARELEARGRARATVTRRLCKVVTIPLAPRTARAIDLAIGERPDGPVFLAADGRRLDRHGAGRIVRRVAPQAGIGKVVTPHTLRHAFITAALDAGSRCPTCRRPPRTLTRERRRGTTAPAAAWTGTRPTSSPPMSQALHGKGVPSGRCSA